VDRWAGSSVTIVPYLAGLLRCQTTESVLREWPDARFVEVGGDACNYWRLLRQNLLNYDEVIVVEHDNVVPYGAARSFARCTEAWCAYEYPGDAHGNLGAGLGLTRIRRQDILPAPVTWPFLDNEISRALHALGLRPHLHGRAGHLHYATPGRRPMTLYCNTDTAWRYWPSLHGPDGRTLALDPEETVELDCKVDDPYLKPVAPKPVLAKAAPKAAAEATDEEN
jgi:hypothetical protein